MCTQCLFSLILVSNNWHNNASSTRIKDAGIAIRHSQGYIVSILQGPEMSLGVVFTHLNEAKLSKRAKHVQNAQNSSKLFKNDEKCNNSANTHPNPAFLTGNLMPRPGEGLGHGPGR